MCKIFRFKSNLFVGFGIPVVSQNFITQCVLAGKLVDNAAYVVV